MIKGGVKDNPHIISNQGKKKKKSELRLLREGGGPSFRSTHPWHLRCPLQFMQALKMDHTRSRKLASGGISLQPFQHYLTGVVMMAHRKYEGWKLLESLAFLLEARTGGLSSSLESNGDDTKVVGTEVVR